MLDFKAHGDLHVKKEDDEIPLACSFTSSTVSHPVVAGAGAERYMFLSTAY